MAQLQYIGARYVPKYYQNSQDPSSSEWEPGKVYEALIVVTWNDVSYTSKIPVPANIGAPDLFPAYWCKLSDLPAATHALQEEVANIETKIEHYKLYNILDYANLMTNNDWSTVINALIDLDSVGCTIYIPEGTYNCKSTIKINKKKVKIIGENRNTTLNLSANVTSFIDMSGDTNACEITNLELDCNNRCQYGIYSSDWCSECIFDNLKVGYADTAGFNAPVFLSSIKNCWFYNSPTGINIPIYSTTRATSTVIERTFVSDCTIGYNVNMTYSNLISCASDRCDIGYYMKDCQGVSMLSCGAEYNKVAVKCDSWWGGDILGFFGYNNGDASYDETHYIFDFSSAVDISIGGYHGTILGSPKLLNLSGTSNGWENITILDSCIKPTEAHFVTNWKFQEPIKFLRNELGHDTTKSVNNAADLRNYIDNELPKEINYNLTINITSDITVDADTKIYIYNRVGNGKILFNLNGHTITSASDVWKIFRLYNNDVPIQITNGTLRNAYNSNQQQLIEAVNSNVSVKGIEFNNPEVKCGSGVSAIEGSIVVVGSDCTKVGDFASDGYYPFMYCDDLSLMDVKASF